MNNTRTKLPIEKEFPKLIRDKIPEIIQQNEGKNTVTRRLDSDEDFLQALLQKSVEEAEELAHTTDDESLKEELADLYEIIDAILALKGMSRADLDAVQKDKRDKRGGFDDRLLMLGKE